MYISVVPSFRPRWRIVWTHSHCIWCPHHSTLMQIIIMIQLMGLWRWFILLPLSLLTSPLLHTELRLKLFFNTSVFKNTLGKTPQALSVVFYILAVALGVCMCVSCMLCVECAEWCLKTKNKIWFIFNALGTRNLRNSFCCSNLWAEEKRPSCAHCSGRHCFLLLAQSGPRILRCVFFFF